jgi:hypothetical protein
MIELISLFILDVQSGFVDDIHDDVRIGTLISSSLVCHLVYPFVILTSMQ